jgi:pectate lyase
MPGRLRPTASATRRTAAIAFAALAAGAFPARAQIPAFPGAEGFGATTPGGRGGAVVEVTNLHDSGPGSLREALQVRTGPRTVVFRVSGTIELAGWIEMKAANSFVTVAGQTTPGEGIQLKNYGLMLRDGIHDVVIRHLRIRPGDTTPGDWNKDGATVYGYGGTPVYNILFDHV